jgi:O-antigen/teichoic acid export membrane protein
MRKRFTVGFRRLDGDLYEVLRGSAFALITKVFAALAGFAMNVAVARLLGAQEAGLFFLGYTVVLVGATLSRVGLDQTVVRFTAGYQASGEWGKIRGLYRTAITWTTIAGLSTACLIFISAPGLANTIFGKPDFADVLFVLAPVVPLLALATLHAYALQGLRMIVKSMLILNFVAPAGLLVLAVVLIPQGAEAVAMLYGLSSALALGLGAVWWHGVLPRWSGQICKADKSELLASCGPLLAAAVLTLMVAWSSQLMLGIWGSSSDVAVFSAAQRTAALCGFILIAVNSISAPKFSAMYRAGQHVALHRTVVHATRLSLGVGAPVLLTILIFPGEIMLLFGPEFVGGAGPLQILAVGQFVNVATGSVGHLLAMTGHERVLRNSVFVAATVSVGFGVALIPSFGCMGAAVATAVGVAIQNLLCWWQTRNLLGINTLRIWGRI